MGDSLLGKTPPQPADDAVAVSVHLHNAPMGISSLVVPQGGEWFAPQAKTLCLDEIT